MNQKISVIIPVYNTEKYIENCLMSIVEQTYSNYEIILVNDGSLDNSITIVKKILKDSNIQYRILEQKNQGVAVARNNGIANATGEWIIAIDSDDLLCKDTFEVAMNYVKDEDVIALDYEINPDKNRIVKVDKNDVHYLSGSEALNGYYTRNYQFVSPGMIIKKSFLLANRITYDDGCRFAEDDIYYEKNLCMANKVMYIRKPLYNYIMHCNSTMTTSKAEKFYTVKSPSIVLNECYIQKSNNTLKYRYAILLRHYLGVLHIVAKLQTYDEYVNLLNFYELRRLFNKYKKKLTFREKISFYIQIYFPRFMYLGFRLV